MAARTWTRVGDVDLVRIAWTSGRVEVVADPDVAEVLSSAAPVSVGPSEATIDGGNSRLRLRVPEGTDLVVGSTSGTVTVSGRVGNVAVVSKSGKVRIDEARSIDVRAVSGSVDVGRIAGRCRAMTSSGRIEIRGCGGADVTAQSGRIALRDVRGPATAHSTSGRVEIELAEAHDVAAETVSGSVTITLPHGVHAHVVESSDPPADGRRDDSNRDDSNRDDSNHCVIAARSTSGRVTVKHR